METEINLKSCLSPRFRIKGADSHLYRIGLSLDKSSPECVRNRFHEPLLILYTAIHLFIHQTIIIFIPERDQSVHIRIGDIGRLIGAKVPLAQACAVVGLLATISFIYNYLNHKNGVKSSELNVFRMMTGLVTPDSLDITDVRSLVTLLRVSRRVLKATEVLAPTVKYCIFFINTLALYTKASEEEFLIGLPYTILWPLLAQYSFNTIIYQFVYYYLLTYHLNLKLKELNKNLRSLMVRFKFNKQRNVTTDVWSVLKNSDRLYAEISEYNQNYWCKFLGALWVLISVEIASMAYLTIFGDIVVVLRMLFSLVTLLFLFILLFVIYISSKIFNESNRSYALLNSIFVANRIRQVSVKIKWLLLIERVGQGGIGFYCYKWFIINNFRGYEIVGLTCVSFIRTIETFSFSSVAT